MKKTIYYILLIILVGNVAFSQTSITVTPRQDSVLIGDHVVLDVVLKCDDINDLKAIDFSGWKTVENLFYEIDTTRLEKEITISIIGNNDWKVSDNNYISSSETIKELYKNKDSLLVSMKVSIYDYGFWVFSPPTIINKSGKRYPKGDPIGLMVMDPSLGVPQDSLALMPIKDIIQEGESWEDYKIWIYILGLILLAPFLIKLLWGRKKETEEEIVEQEIFIPAHEKALSALQALKQKELWQSGNVKGYQSELTVIIRRYLEDRFDVNALEMTSDEINRALRQKDFDTKHSSTLQRILTIADLVKFAKATPPVDINAQFMEEAEQFVNSTKKIEAEQANDE